MSIWKKIGIIGFGIIGIAIIFFLYICSKIYYSELEALSGRWDLHIPPSAKLEEFHATETGFHGDGNRILVVTCSEGDKKYFGFDYKSFNPKLSSEDKSFIRSCYEVLPNENVSKMSKSNYLKSMRATKHGNNSLLIVYDEMSARYFIFEELT